MIPTHGVDYFVHTHPFNDPFTWSSLDNAPPPPLMISLHGVV